MASSIAQSRNSRISEKEEASARGKKQTAGMPASAGARKRAVQRGGNIHIQDEDQAPTGTNAGDTQAAIERQKAHDDTTVRGEEAA